MHLRSHRLARATLLLANLSAVVLGDRQCKAYPGSADWPSAKSWRLFNETLQGRLLQPSPPAAACHPPSYDEDQCAQIQEAWSGFEFHTGDPVSVMWDQFTNFTCLPDPKAPCDPHGAGYPSFVVNASTAEHVKLGVDFARDNKLRLVVKATGHDYLGRSIAPGTLSIWLHHLNGISYHDGEFRLEGSDTMIPGSALTVGGGTQMYNAYSAADAHNKAIVGGGGKTVGMGGYVTGAGHSVLSARYGLAADNVLQMEVVTPAGAIVVANEDVHPDLFWALRGGGGSTFGVVTSITMKAHPSPAIVSLPWMAYTEPESPIRFDLASLVLSHYPSLMDSGLSGYSVVTSRSANPMPGPGLPDEVAGVAGNFILQDSNSTEAAEKLFQPLNDTINSKWPGQASLLVQPTPYDNFLDWFDVNFDTTPTGGSAYLVSRLLDLKALTGDTDSLSKALEDAMALPSGLSAFPIAGEGVQNAEPRGGGNAVNPGWRASYVHAIATEAFPPLNATAEKDTIRNLDEIFQPMRELAPETGAYLNEALAFEKDWQRTFWGDNYERLLSIKRSVDPEDVFWCVPCVGHDSWEELEDGRLCKVD